MPAETNKQRKAREKAEAKARKEAEKAERKRLAQADGSADRKKARNRKLLNCAAGAAVGVLATLAFGGKRRRGAGDILLSGAAGCAAGWALGEALKGDDADRMDNYINQDAALRSDQPEQVWRAPNSGESITIRQSDAGYKQAEATLLVDEGVEPPQPGVLIEGRAMRTTTAIRLRSSPSAVDAENRIGSFGSNEIVYMVAQTADRQWAMISENNVIVGYVATRYLSSSLAVPPQAPIAYASLKKPAPPRPAAPRKGGKGSKAAAPPPPVMLAHAPPQAVRVPAALACKSFTASHGSNSSTQKRCANSTGMTWA